MKNFVVYNSSAGSGKTFTLVKEYLRLVLTSDNPMYFRHILAITFTNKAASEMKERVLSALVEIAYTVDLQGTPKFLLLSLLEPKEKGGIGLSEKVIRKRTQNVLKKLLHNYSFFGISTIDKFTLRLIKTFAKDLDIPLSFDVSLDEQELLESSVDLLIDQVGRDEVLTDVLLKYVYSQMDRDVNWQIENNLIKTAKKLLDEDAGEQISSLSKIDLSKVPEIYSRLTKEINEIERSIQEVAQATLSKVAELGIESSSFFRGYFPKFLQKAETKPFSPPNTTLQKMLGGMHPWFAKSKPRSQQILIEENENYFLEQLLNIISIQEDKKEKYHLNLLLRENIYSFSLLGHLAKMNQEVKKDQNVLSFTDFNQRISNVIDQEPLPFIYERLGEKYNHYLIDEFQDTSIRQWKNLLPLVDNSLSKGFFNLLVGDAKQAIYRFRGGEVDQIIELPKLLGERNPIIEEREASLVRNYEQQILDNNYRSKKEIVDFNNQFFRHVSKWLSDKYKIMYESLDQKYIDTNDGGGVRLTFYEKSNQETFLEVCNDRVLALIKEYSGNFALNQIAILTRTNVEGRQLADFLLDNGVAVISPDSLVVTKSIKVKFVVQMLKYMVSAHSKENQFVLIEYLSSIRNISIDDSHALLQKIGVNFKEVIKEWRIHFDEKELLVLPLYELVSEIILLFDLEKECDIYIQFLLDIVHLYVQKYDNTITGFLEWWESTGSSMSVAVPSDADAVQIMSVHKSKGLEFDVVIIPFQKKGVKIKAGMSDWVGGVKSDGIDTAILPYNNLLKETVHKELVESEMEKVFLDTINLLYVGLTRPKHYMEILTQWNPVKESANDVSNFYTDFCLDKEEVRTELDDRVEYMFGSPFQECIISKEENIENDFTIKNVVRGSWRESIQISSSAPKEWDVLEPRTIGELGVVVHSVMADIYTAEDVSVAVLKAKENQVIGAADGLEEVINEVISLPEVIPFFQKGLEVYNEKKILLPSGEVYIPDRVVYIEGKIVIMDYKTGLMKKNHETQVKNYAQIYQEMTGKEVQSYLLYIDMKKMLRVY